MLRTSTAVLFILVAALHSWTPVQAVNVPAVPNVAAADPFMWLDAPTSGATLESGQPLTIWGWALDRGATTGSGIDAVHVWAFPLAGGVLGEGTWIGAATLGIARPDLVNAYGSQFANSGFYLSVAPKLIGTYRIAAYARSTVTGTFSQVRAADVVFTASPVMELDSPVNGATLVSGRALTIWGWALDHGATGGSGTETVHVWAFPLVGGGTGTFLGTATLGIPRPDVESAHGSQYANSGFFLSVTPRLSGRYRIAAYARSTVTGTFSRFRWADVTFTADPVTWIDSPFNGTTISQPFTIRGWAVDRAAASGTGVDYVHVWAYRAGSATPTFLGSSYGGSRPDVGAVFGAAFTNSGYSVDFSGLAAGTYTIVVSPHSAVTNTNNDKFLQVEVGAVADTVATPTFTPPGGTYGSAIRVNMLSTTDGATIHYVTDGSTPTAASPIYGTPIDVKAGATTTIKAIAVKRDQTTSGVASATYTTGTGTPATWNGLTTFSLVNGTKGKYPDSQVYWAVIGKDWNTDKFVHVDLSGNLIPMSLADNGALVKNGQSYTNYFYTLSQASSLVLPAINSARLVMSVGGPMFIQVNTDVNGKIGYAFANLENPMDPNIDVTFDFGEFAIVPKGADAQGIFINTSRVDQFGFPLQLTVTGLDGFSQTVGESLSATRDELFAKFVADVPAAFQGLAQSPYAPYRIQAPAHATFGAGGVNANYLDAYIAQIWNQYTNQDLIIDLKDGSPLLTGRVTGDVFKFTDAAGTYYINGRPTTSMVLLGDGLLNDPSKATTVAKQLQIQAQVCAALNRHVAELTFDKWWDSRSFYPAGQVANFFAKFWHDNSLNALSYGFAYDDVGGYSPSIHTASPVSVTVTIGR